MSDSDNSDNMEKLQRLKETVLKEYPRLSADDTFTFGCHPGVPCFNQCCGDVTIVLTPYDVLRLKRRLGLSSQDFLARHTLIPFNQDQKLPMVVMKMNDDENRTCPLVGPDGCTVYDDRPWACRMYPIGSASANLPVPGQQSEFFFLLQEPGCQGFAEGKTWTIREWVQDQGVETYNAFGKLFQDIAHHEQLVGGRELEPAQMEMFYLAQFDLDKFRTFILESSFLERFDVEPETVEKIKADDEELLKFAHRWLKFSLFGEQTIPVKDEALAEQKRKMQAAAE